MTDTNTPIHPAVWAAKGLWLATTDGDTSKVLHGLLTYVSVLESQLEAKDRLNAELCQRISGRRIPATPYDDRNTQPKGEM